MAIRTRSANRGHSLRTLVTQSTSVVGVMVSSIKSYSVGDRFSPSETSGSGDIPSPPFQMLARDDGPGAVVTHRSCRSLMLYQMAAVTAASIRQRKTAFQYSNGNRMPPRIKASPNPTNSLPVKRNIRLSRQASSCELLLPGSDGAFGVKLPTIMKTMPIITEPPRAWPRFARETMPKERASSKAWYRAQNTLQATTHFPLQRCQDGRAS